MRAYHHLDAGQPLSIYTIVIYNGLFPSHGNTFGICTISNRSVIFGKEQCDNNHTRREAWISQCEFTVLPPEKMINWYWLTLSQYILCFCFLFSVSDMILRGATCCVYFCLNKLFKNSKLKLLINHTTAHFMLQYAHTSPQEARSLYKDPIMPLPPVPAILWRMTESDIWSFNMDVRNVTVHWPYPLLIYVKLDMLLVNLSRLCLLWLRKVGEYSHYGWHIKNSSWPDWCAYTGKSTIRFIHGDRNRHSNLGHHAWDIHFGYIGSLYLEPIHCILNMSVRVSVYVWYF